MKKREGDGEGSYNKQMRLNERDKERSFQMDAKKKEKVKKKSKRTGWSSGPHQSSKPASEKLRRAIPVRVVSLGFHGSGKRCESPLVVSM